MNNGDGTGTLSGTATTYGTFPIIFTAYNGVAPNVVQNFTLIIYDRHKLLLLLRLIMQLII